MTLLDASVIIDALRTGDLQRLSQMHSAGAVICGVTRAEILSGVRSAQDRLKLVTILDGFPQVAIPDAMWDEVGDLQALLRANGVTVPLADAVLAAVAISLDTDVWSRDSDFENIQRLCRSSSCITKAAELVSTD